MKKWDGNMETDLLAVVNSSNSDSDMTFHSLPNLTLTFQEAETNKLLQPFDRIVVRIQKKSS